MDMDLNPETHGADLNRQLAGLVTRSRAARLRPALISPNANSLQTSEWSIERTAAVKPRLAEWLVMQLHQDMRVRAPLQTWLVQLLLYYTHLGFFKSVFLTRLGGTQNKSHILF